MKITVLDTDTLTYGGDLPLDVFLKFGEVEFYEQLPNDEVKKVTENTDILLVNKTPVTRKLMESAKNLKMVGVFATGYNNIDIPAAKEMGITVCNAGSYSTDAVAQQTFAYILNKYSRVNEYGNLVNGREWINSKTFSMLCLTTDELAGKTIGIVGYGNIGKRVADIALCFNMKVLAFNRSKKTDDRVSFVPFDELLAKSDIVSVHCPLNDQNKDMFGKDAFSKMKDGAFFINTARGGLVDEDALLSALESGKLSGAALDVLKSEPMSESCPLLNAKNLIITPHTAWTPLGTRKRLLQIVADNVEAFLEKRPQNVVSK